MNGNIVTYFLQKESTINNETYHKFLKEGLKLAIREKLHGLQHDNTSLNTFQ